LRIIIKDFKQLQVFAINCNTMYHLGSQFDNITVLKNENTLLIMSGVLFYYELYD